MYGTSETLRAVLVKQGMTRSAAGTAGLRGIGDGASVGKDTQRHQPAGREEEPQPMGIRLVWTNMAMRQTTQTPRAVAPRGVVSLMVIIGGKP